MKHLKLYDKNNYIIIISERDDIPYYILKIDYLDEEEIHYIEYGFYDQNDNDFTYKHYYKSKGIIKTKKYPILYQTTIFKKAKEMLKTIIISSKYNI